jgi:hypothetical protein
MEKTVEWAKADASAGEDGALWRVEVGQGLASGCVLVSSFHGIG